MTNMFLKRHTLIVSCLLGLINSSHAMEEDQKTKFCRIFDNYSAQTPGVQATLDRLSEQTWGHDDCAEKYDILKKRMKLGVYGYYRARKIDDTGVELLEGFDKTWRLYLGGTSITDKALDTVGRLSGLRQLLLENTAITDEGIRKLANLRNLEYLDVHNTQVTEEGVSFLKQEIPGLVIRTKAPWFGLF